jgi:hypothetical protein
MKNIDLFELHKDSHTIFPIEQADYKREWMDSYPHSFAYRCLPLKIANEAGWLVRSPINFTAEYLDDTNPLGSVKVTIPDNEDLIYRSYITSHFGRGVITFSLPYIFRTEYPHCIWARGYPNYYKDNVNFLEGIIETYWLNSTFTYNIRLVEKNKVVSFVKGDPILFLTVVDLATIDHSTITYRSIEENPQLKDDYNTWRTSRSNFNQSQRDPKDWQKDYFKGINSNGSVQENHYTTIKTYVKD